MVAVQFLVLSACVFSLASTSAIEAQQMDVHKQQMIDFEENAKELTKYPCQLPQTRVYRVEELLKKEDLEHKAFYPEMTVLQSCGYTGCCLSGFSCVAKGAIKVRRAFKVTYLTNVGPHKIGTWAVEYYDLLSHTECHCVDPHQAQEYNDGYSLVNRFGESSSSNQTEESAPTNSSSTVGEGYNIVYPTDATALNAV